MRSLFAPLALAVLLTQPALAQDPVVQDPSVRSNTMVITTRENTSVTVLLKD